MLLCICVCGLWKWPEKIKGAFLYLKDLLRVKIRSPWINYIYRKLKIDTSSLKKLTRKRLSSDDFMGSTLIRAEQRNVKLQIRVEAGPFSPRSEKGLAGPTPYLRTCGGRAKLAHHHDGTRAWRCEHVKRTKEEGRGGNPFNLRGSKRRGGTRRSLAQKVRDCFVYSSGSLTAFQRDGHRKENCIVIKTAAAAATVTAAASLLHHHAARESASAPNALSRRRVASHPRRYPIFPR